MLKRLQRWDPRARMRHPMSHLKERGYLAAPHQWAASAAASRRMHGRCLVVPRQWTGSVEHYYHFLMAYLYPLVLHVSDAGTRKITVRECGPLDDWLRLLAHTCDVEIVPAGTMLARLVGESQDAVILEPTDDPDTLDPARLQAFRDAFPHVTGVPLALGGARAAVVLDRGPAHPFYTGDAIGMRGTPEVEGAGASRRSLANVDVIGQRVGGHLTTRVVDAAALAPRAQVDVFARAQVLVGQHGAGLANMIWMRAPGLVVEILPPEVRGVPRGIYRSLARALSLEYVAVPQDGLHAGVDPGAVDAAVASFLGSR